MFPRFCQHLLACCCLASAHGHAPSFIERVWLLEEGLAHNVVHRVIQDKRGFLWVTTANGLSRFDGRDFKDYSPVIPGDFRLSVRDMAFTPDGALILLPAAGGVMLLEDGVTSRHPLSDALFGQQSFHVFVEPGGAIWIAGGGLYRWQDGRLETFGSEQGFHRKLGARYSFTTDDHGATWVSMGSEVFRYKGGRLTPQPGDFGENVSLAPASNGGVWLLTESRLFRANGDAIQEISASSEWKRTGEVMAFIEDKNGALWIATRSHGLFRFAEMQLSEVPISHQRLSSVMEDAEGNIWVSSNGGGLLRIRPRAFVTLPSEAGIPAEATSSISEGLDGTLWLANRDNSLARWKNNQLQIVTPLAPSRNKFFIVCADRAGWIWASGEDGLYRFPADHPEKIERLADINGAVYALHCTSNGDVWVSADQRRTGFFRDSLYHPITPANGAPDGRISAFVEDVAGNLWMTTQDGALLQYRDNRLIRDPVYAQKFGDRIHALHADRDGSLWIGTRVGLIRKRGDDYRFISAAHGLPDDLIIQILEDDSRRLWIGSRRGIYTVALEDLNAIADGRQSLLGAFTLGRNEGLIGAYSFVSGPPTALRGSDGILWFTTHRGVVGVDPFVQLPGSKPPLVYIDEVSIYGEPHRLVEGQVLRIPASASPVEFRFAAISLSAPEKIRIRHRLTGLETEWTETTTQRSATYARLPPGTYELAVTVGNQAGAWSEKPVQLTLVVEPSWWQTWWVRGAALLAFTAAIIFGARHWSHRRLQARLTRLEQAHALEQERARIARDLHDELGGSLTQIGLLAERVKRQSTNTEIEQPLNDLASHTRSIATELESIVWTVSPKNSTWSALEMFISGFAPRFFRNAEISCTIERTGAVPTKQLPPEVQHHVLAIIKEAMNNVCKHARASSAVLTLGTENDSFLLRLKDDGIGFNPAAPEHSERNGLSNMRARSQEIGASLLIESRPDSGTELVLRVPLNAHAFTARPARG